MKYVKKEDEKLMCVKALGGPKTYSQAFDILEGKLPSIKGRRFYGLSRVENDALAYFACTRIEPADGPLREDFVEILLNSGKYERRIVKDWQVQVDRIGDMVLEMAAENDVDETRYTVEYYRRADELHLLLPIK